MKTKQAVDSLGQLLYLNDKVYIKQPGLHRKDAQVSRISKIDPSGAKYVLGVVCVHRNYVQKYVDNETFIRFIEKEDKRFTDYQRNHVSVNSEFVYFEYHHKITTLCIKVFDQN